ncbi:hypothetical protein ACQ4PT_008230 [Festuca glaucescens]
MAEITSTAIYALLIFFACCLPPTAVPLSFDYPSFGSDDQRAIRIEGDASFSIGRVDISANQVDGIHGSKGRASYSAQPMVLWDEHTGEVASFSTRFSFNIKAKNISKKGCGMAFFLASYPSSLPTGSSAYYNLGLTNLYEGAVATGDSRFVAVEFDTLSETQVSDPNSTLDHIGIDVNSLISVNTSDLPSFSLNGTMTATIQYDNVSSIMALTLWLGDGSSYSLSSKVDLKSALPAEVSVGFSASTAGSIELHQLLSWHFNSSLERKTAPMVAPPVQSQPSSGTSSSGVIAGAAAGTSLFLVLLLGISALLVRRRRNKKKQEAEGKDMDSSEGEVIMELELGTGPKRMKIVLDLGSALLYLHEEWDQCVVHRDIKPSNVMLDESFGAKLGDFGLARFIDHAVGLKTMTVVSGTPGYVDPQCLITGRASSESDIYSFGVVLLEVACGTKPMSTLDKKKGVFRLAEWVWDLYGQGGVLDAVDQRLDGRFDEAEAERVMVVGLWCAHPDPTARPSIRTAMATLQSKDAKQLPLLPSKMPVPTYAPPMAPWDGQSSSSSAGMSTSTVTRSSTTSGFTGP